MVYWPTHLLIPKPSISKSTLAVLRMACYPETTAEHPSSDNFSWASYASVNLHSGTGTTTTTTTNFSPLPWPSLNHTPWLYPKSIPMLPPTTQLSTTPSWTEPSSRRPQASKRSKWSKSTDTTSHTEDCSTSTGNASSFLSESWTWNHPSTSYSNSHHKPKTTLKLKELSGASDTVSKTSTCCGESHRTLSNLTGPWPKVSSRAP